MYQKLDLLWPADQGPNPAFCGEDERLSVLASHGIDTLEGDEELTEIAAFAAKLCDTPIGSVTVVEAQRQFFLAKSGLERSSTPRTMSFCAHAMVRSDPLIVEDATKHPDFADNFLVTGGMGLRFYAGFPLISSEGAPLGALCVIDTQPHPEGLSDTQRQGMRVLAKAAMRRLSQMRLGSSAREAVERKEADLRDMIDSVPGIAWMGDNKGNFGYVNARWTEATGLPPPTKAEEWRVAIHPEDRATSGPEFRRAVAAGEPYEGEWRLQQADGSYRWVQSRAVPVAGPDGTVRWFGTIIDIDASRRMSEARDLLANELSHRIKNIFAVVSGLITLRARGQTEVKPFADELTSAIQALGTAHDYVRTNGSGGADQLKGLLEDLLAPYEGARGERVAITGDDVAIGARGATPLALIFHELATNAAKYGALKDAEGKVAINIDRGAENEIVVTWAESSPKPDPREDEQREGFGSRLLRMAVEGQLGGKFSREFSDDGLDVRIAFPAEAMGS